MLPARTAGERGFTILELSAVVFIITILVSLLCAALNNTKAKALRISCLANMKQLQIGWIAYIDDNDGFLPLNQTAPVPNHPRIPAMRTSSNSWVAGNPRLDLNTDNIRNGTLFDYVLSVSPYRCPQDSSTVEGEPNIPRTRSYSMNAYLGGDPFLNPPPKMKESELENPKPDSVFVFIEEHENSSWGSSFIAPPLPKGKPVSTGSLGLSTPSDRHNQGCNISFADGHIAYWKWYSPKNPRKSDSQLSASNARDAADMNRLRACVPQP